MHGYIQKNWWHKFQSPDDRSSKECMVEQMISLVYSTMWQAHLMIERFLKESIQ
jgi:hypothetical protein